MIPVRVRAPQASVVVLVRFDASGAELGSEPLRRDGDDWVGAVADGHGATGWSPRATGPASTRPSCCSTRGPPRCGSRPVTTVSWPGAGASTRRARRRWPSPGRRGPARPPRRSTPGAGRLRGPRAGDDEAAATVRSPARTPGSSTSCPAWPRSASPSSSCCPSTRTIPRRAATGGTCRWPSAPSTASTPPVTIAAGELAAFVAAAHDHDIEVWLDVVFNHTTEVDETGPDVQPAGTVRRGVLPAARRRLVRRDDRVRQRPRRLVAGGPGPRRVVARPVRRPRRRRLPLRPRRRARPGRVVRRAPGPVGRRSRRRRWWPSRGTPSGPTSSGRPGRDAGWRQWNDRFREDVRGFLRGEEGLAEALALRLQGSPDVFAAPMESVNFITCHDGFTLYDLVRLRPQAQRGQRARQPRRFGRQPLVELRLGGRRRRARRGRRAASPPAAQRVVPAGHGPRRADGRRWATSCGRTQGGNNNAYNQDNETSWVDWSRAAGFADLERFVGLLLALRHRHPVLPSRSGGVTPCSSTAPAAPPTSAPTPGRWPGRSADLYVIANAWWEPLEFWLQRPGPWRRVVDTVAAAARRHRRARRRARRPALRRRPPLRRHPRTPHHLTIRVFPSPSAARPDPTPRLGRDRRGSAPAGLFVGVDAEAQLADELVGEHRVAGVDPAEAGVAEQLLEPAAAEDARAAR